MKYEYCCENKECVKYNIIFTIKMKLSEVKTPHNCKYCKSKLIRTWSPKSSGIKTSDGYKL